MELTTSPNTSFSFSSPSPPTVPPIDLTKALNRNDLTFNVNLDQNDTVPFSQFVRVYKMAGRLAFRVPQAGDPDESILVEAFLYSERLLREHGATDPRIPYLFAELLVRLDDYDYAFDCLKNLEATLAMPSTDINFAMTEVQRLRTRRVSQWHQALSKLNPSEIGWVYSATSCAPLPNLLVSIQVPVVQFAPFTLEHLSSHDLERLLRSISVHTNVLEGVLKLNAGQSETLITLGFASSTFSHDCPSNMSENYIKQTLLDSQAAIQLVLDRVGSANAKFDESFVSELHRAFTKTACITTQRTGECFLLSSYIGRGRYKFLSNHVFARNKAYHVYCPPEDVPAEMKKIFDMLGNYLTDTQKTPENGIWLAAWFHHRFVNIHPFRDGNGRVTRALVSAILLRFGLLPFLVADEDKNVYFHALMTADADGSNLAPLAKFIARQQLHAYFLCKTREPVVRQQASEFRRLRIEEAHKFIQQKASDVAEAYNKKVSLTSRAPSLTVYLHDHRILEISLSSVVDLHARQRIYLIYGSLCPLETDIFVFYIVTPSTQNNDVASVRGLTGVLYSQAIDVWETKLELCLTSDLDEVLRLVREGM